MLNTNAYCGGVVPPVAAPGVPVGAVPVAPVVPPIGSVGPVVPVPIMGSAVAELVESVVVAPPLRPLRVRLDDRLCVVVDDDVGLVGDAVV